MKTKKEEYIDKIAKDLKEVSATIDEFEARAARVKMELQEELGDRLVELKEKRDQLEGSLRELKGAAGTAWDVMQAGIEKAKQDLTGSFRAARDVFKRAA